MILSIESLSAMLDLLACRLVLTYPISSKFSAAARTAGLQFNRIHLILAHIELLFPIDVCYALFLQLLQFIKATLLPLLDFIRH